jgi:hypothetical protein
MSDRDIDFRQEKNPNKFSRKTRLVDTSFKIAVNSIC